MTHLPESRPGYNDQLQVNEEGYLDVRTHDGSLELLGLPAEVAKERGHWAHYGWPITHLLKLLGVDTSEGHCYRLRVESLDSVEERTHEAP